LEIDQGTGLSNIFALMTKFPMSSDLSLRKRMS
jgi:hypothetical protein